MNAILASLAETGATGRHQPWPRAEVNADGWHLAGNRMAAGQWTLLGLWATAAEVHAAVRDTGAGDIAVLTIQASASAFPSLGAIHPPAIRLERALADLHGLAAVGLADARPWLDHDAWGTRAPLGEASTAATQKRPYTFLPVHGEGLHQIAVGPVHAGIIEPGHFRFTANGEAIARLEQRLGYTHKGIESLMAGADFESAARLAGRCSGDSTVAYAIAFAQAVEAATRTAVPPRAAFLRALMAEIERLANHFGDIGAICNDASFAALHAQFAILRERTLRLADACFGHRLMMDCVMPGGVAADILAEGAAAMRGYIADARGAMTALVDIYDNTASLKDRTVGTGVLRPELASQFGAGGFVGRASGRAFDARKSPGYAPYDRLDFEVPVLNSGDVNARLWVRVSEVEQSLRLLTQILAQLPGGAVRATGQDVAEVNEGMALVEGFRGDVLAWVRTSGGRVVHAHLRDPSWFQWPLLEAAIEGNIVADFPLCNKSFNCSYSGHDR